MSFQSGPSETLTPAERMELPGRGQLRVIDRGPQARSREVTTQSGATGEAAGATTTETLLLVHGYGASTASWRPLLPELSRRYRVIAVDLPGFGRSDRLRGDYSPAALADVLARILDEKKIDRAHVAGHSWGASVALAFAHRYPERLGKLIVVSGWMYEEQLLPLLRWARAPGLGEGLYALFYREAIGERLYLNFHDPALVTEAAVDEVKRQMALDGAVAAALAAARGMRFGEHEAEYRRIGAEALLVWGREDRVSRPAFGERLAEELPHARFRSIPRCGHVPQWECGGELAAAMLDFLAAPDRNDAVASTK